MNRVKNYLSLVTFSHTIFAMPFALIGFYLAIKKPFSGFTQLNLNTSISWSNYSTPFIANNSLSHKLLAGMNPYWGTAIYLGLVILCMVFARSAAMGFNRWLDAKYDAMNPRTAIREIPAGVIKPNNALAFVIINCILFITATFFINSLCFYLSPVALFVILFYSYTKRFTALCHLVLGVGLSLAPIGAYIAVTGQFGLLPIIFSFTVLFWVSGFDIIYALQDEHFDKQHQLHSIPSAVGKVKALRISEMLHFLSAACVITAGFYGHFGYFYWAGAIFYISLLIYQHLLVKPNDLSKVNRAFFTTNGIASVVFAIFVILDLFLHSTGAWNLNAAP
ncbi:UbiA-like polyprenyltransferase [Ferruginibacter sp.]